MCVRNTILTVAKNGTERSGIEAEEELGGFESKRHKSKAQKDWSENGKEVLNI